LMANLELVRGTRDFLPEEKIFRDRIISIFRTAFENYGFVPIETPAIEKWETLSAKFAGGASILEETYNFDDRAGRKIGLRYDLTVPLARVVAMNPNLIMPFKRYSIDKVWRYEEFKPGRYREFYQCDCDIVGVKSMLAESECFSMAVNIFSKLGFDDYIIKLNNRKILSALLDYAGIKTKKDEVFLIIDKLDKMGSDEASKMLIEIGIKKEKIEKLFKTLQIKGSSEKILVELEKLISKNEGIDELREILSYGKLMGFGSRIQISLSLVRGLSYYTGTIFEFSVSESKIGTITAGGRYDSMISKFAGKENEIPAFGISFGIERIIDVMKKRNMYKSESSLTKVFTAPILDKVLPDAIVIAENLRKKGINTEIEMLSRTLKKQLEYADKKGIEYVVILGEKEISEKMATVRNMKTKEEKKINFNDIYSIIK